MDFNKLTARILVKKDFGVMYDFYTDKLGLQVTWGDRNGPYVSLGMPGHPPCFALFSIAEMAELDSYQPPEEIVPNDSVVCVVPCADLQADFERLRAKGVAFLGEPQRMEEWGMSLVCFRDPEGNLIELNDADGI